MDDMDDLVAWIREQLDKDERVAQAAMVEIAAWGGSWVDFTDNIEHRAVIDADSIADHMERHDPDRGLREVEATRRILAELEYSLRGEGMAHYGGLTFAVKALASVYADRPGYREEWRP